MDNAENPIGVSTGGGGCSRSIRRANGGIQVPDTEIAG